MEGQLNGELGAAGISPPPALEISDLSKSFGANRALDNVSLAVKSGEIHALLGENGSGKSTLIKILAGYHLADPGGVVRVGGQDLAGGRPALSHARGLRFVHQDLGLVETETVADNFGVTAGYPSHFGTLSHRELRDRTTTALTLAGLDLDPRTLIRDLSPAERTGVAVARALEGAEIAEATLLVLDEPTATLHEAEVGRLLDIVQRTAARGVAVLYVTHRLDEVFRICDRATVLRDGKAVATHEVGSVSRAELVHDLVGRDFEEREHGLAQKHQPGAEAAVLGVSELSAGRLSDLSFDVLPGMVVGIAGVTGSGREDVCAAIFGAERRRRGSVTVNGASLPPARPDVAMSHGVTFLPANRRLHGGMMNMTARENLTVTDLRSVSRRGRVVRRLESDETELWFGELDVRPRNGAEQLLSAFSGGNQQKILLGKWLRRRPVVMLLNEPTQGVDIGAKAQLHEQIRSAAKNGAAVVVSSADGEELVTLCDVVLVLRDGRFSAELTGEAMTVNAMVTASSAQLEANEP